MGIHGCKGVYMGIGGIYMGIKGYKRVHMGTHGYTWV